MFLGKWSNEEGIFSFQYKDGVYCGGAVSDTLNTVLFDEYSATEDTITIYTEDGNIETFHYEFVDDYLYLDDEKFERR